MANTEIGAGWLPVEAVDALEVARDKASQELASRLLGLPPEQRVLELMRLAAAGLECDAPMRPEDLIRVLASFPGAAPPPAEELCRLFPGAVLPRG